MKCQKSLTQTPVDETDLEKEIVATRSFSVGLVSTFFSCQCILSLFQEPIADSTCSQFKKFLVEHEKRMFALQKSLENFLTQTSKQTRERKAALTRKVPPWFFSAILVFLLQCLLGCHDLRDFPSFEERLRA